MENNNNGSPEAAVSPEAASSDVSVQKLAKQLEEGAATPDGIPEPTRLECAWYLKNRGRSTAEAAGAVGLHEKKVQRYFHDKKLELRVQFGPEFQAEMISDFINGSKARTQQLLRLADTPDISISEQIKIIFLQHQVAKDTIEYLLRLGYLTRERGQDEADGTFNRAEIMKEIFAEDKRRQELAERGEGSAPSVS